MSTELHSSSFLFSLLFLFPFSCFPATFPLFLLPYTTFFFLAFPYFLHFVYFSHFFSFLFSFFCVIPFFPSFQVYLFSSSFVPLLLHCIFFLLSICPLVIIPSFILSLLIPIFFFCFFHSFAF